MRVPECSTSRLEAAHHLSDDSPHARRASHTSTEGRRASHTSTDGRQGGGHRRSFDGHLNGHGSGDDSPHANGPSPSERQARAKRHSSIDLHPPAVAGGRRNIAPRRKSASVAENMEMDTHAPAPTAASGRRRSFVPGMLSLDFNRSKRGSTGSNLSHGDHVEPSDLQELR